MSRTYSIDCHSNVTHLEPPFSVYTWNILRIFQLYAVLTNTIGIYVVYPWISNGVDIHGVSMNILSISVKYVLGTSMDVQSISFNVLNILFHAPSEQLCQGKYKRLNLTATNLSPPSLAAAVTAAAAAVQQGSFSVVL
jgi:hypothetical protein